jgi:hypothetical protein
LTTYPFIILQQAQDDEKEKVPIPSARSGGIDKSDSKLQKYLLKYSKLI